jgi:hypothetical protein
MVKYTITLVNLTRRCFKMERPEELSIKLGGINIKGLNNINLAL